MAGVKVNGIHRTLICTITLLAWAVPGHSQSLDDAHVVPRTDSDQVNIASGASLPALKPRPMRVDVDLVLVPVTVTDSFSHPVMTLSKNDFLLYEGDEPQLIQYFSGEDAPLSIALVLDFSASMKNKIEYERQAVERVLQQRQSG